jgi:alpha-mannosidase
MIKKNNRLSELSLREMEFWSSLALERGVEYDREKADELWKTLLLHQFHDILPGSSIARVYVEAEQTHHKLQKEVSKLTDRALDGLIETKQTDAVTVWNSLGFPRKELVSLPECFAEGAKTLEGETVAVQADGQTVKALVSIPAGGAVSLVPAKTGKNKSEAVLVREEENGFVLENSQVTAKINREGEVVSFVLKESGREFAAEPMNRFRLYKDVPRIFDAWDIDSNYIEQEIKALDQVKVERYHQRIFLYAVYPPGGRQQKTGV